MANYVYPAIGLIGGTAGFLDAIDGTNLADKDMAVVSVQGDKTYFYVLDVDSAAAEASPNIIQPDANGGDKRWLLVGFTDLHGLYTESVFSSQAVGTSGQYSDNTSITLTAGDWDVLGQWIFERNGATITGLSCGILPVTGNDSTGLAYGDNFTLPIIPTAYCAVSVQTRVSIAVETIYYLKSNVTYSVATPNVIGKISARRAR